MILAQVSNQGPSIGDLIWIIILLSAFQPALQRYFLTMRRLRMLRRVERQRGTRVIALIHRQETMGLLGFPILRYLDIQDSEEVLRAIRLTPPRCPSTSSCTHPADSSWQLIRLRRRSVTIPGVSLPWCHNTPCLAGR
jgi:hypothetical protein